MTPLQFGFLALIFFAVFIAVILVFRLMESNPVKQRLRVLVGRADPVGGHTASPWVARIVKLTGPLAKLSLPSEGWETSALRLRFMNAGFRHPLAPAIFFAAKTGLAIGLPLILFLALSTSNAKYDTNTLLFYVLGAAAIGNYLPNLVLNRVISQRQRNMFQKPFRMRWI